LKRFLHELQRRNVIKAAISYAVFSWVLIQIASILYPSLGWGQKAITNTVIVLIIGFPLWIVFAYVFEWTPKGFKKTEDVAEEASVAKATGKKMTNIIVIGLTLAVVLLVSDRIFNFTGGMETPAVNDKSIAVLAFADMSPDQDQEYFSDGISEEILNLLAKVPDLKVISRTSSFAYKGKEENISKIGEEFKVNHVLEGSIRKSGNTFRITAQLINVSDGAHVWSETYDREMSDIFRIQDEIAGKVTQQLKATLFGDELTSKTANTEAYNLFLQAKQLKDQNSSESTKNALKFIKESIAIDSTYAPTWALFSNIVYDAAFRHGLISIIDGLKEGKEAAKKAISLDPNYANGYVELAKFERFSWNFEAENELLEKAMLLDSHNAQIIKARASSALNFGHIDLAIELQLKTIELDPLSAIHYYNLGFYYLISKDYTKADSNLSKYLLLFPNSSSGNNLMAQIQISMGYPEKAIPFIEKDTDPFWSLYNKTMAIFGMGKTEEGDALLKQLITDWGNDSWPNIAHVHAYRGEKDEAFKWLNLAYENKDGSLLEILNYPEMENLWGDPRWNAFIDKLGLPEDHGFHRD